MQAQEAADLKKLRKQLDQNVKARPMPDLSHPFVVNYAIAPPATKPKPFKLLTAAHEHAYHSLAHAPRCKVYPV
jgi:hypothetical protein